MFKTAFLQKLSITWKFYDIFFSKISVNKPQTACKRAQNSQHCCANHRGRCWLKSEQRYFVIYRRNTYEQYSGYNLFQNAEFKANFNKNLKKMLTESCVMLAVVCKRRQQFPTSLGPVVHRGKNTTHTSLWSMRNERAWPLQCWKNRANGSNIVALRFGDHGTKEMLGVVGWKVWPVLNFAQQHGTTSNNMQQGVQTDATCNIQQYCVRLHGASELHTFLTASLKSVFFYYMMKSSKCQGHPTSIFGKYLCGRRFEV